MTYQLQNRSIPSHKFVQLQGKKMLPALRLTTISLLIAATAAQFSYDPSAANGPSSWSTLTLGPNVTNQCSGSSNSPIALNSSSCSKFADYKFQGGDCNLDSMEAVLLNNAVEIVYPNSTVCTAANAQIPGVDGTYAIKQFHIHTSSEHVIDGIVYGAELHLVHQLVGGKQLSVVGIQIQSGSSSDNQIFAPLLTYWKEEYLKVLNACNMSSDVLTEDSASRRYTLTRRQSTLFNAYDLVPQGSTFYTYSGGLTTPPCTEGVWWNVVDKPLLVSVRQFGELSTIILGYRNTTTCERASIASSSGSTSRPVQPLNGRTVTRVCPVGYVDGLKKSGTSGATSIIMLNMVGFALTGLAVTLSFLLPL